MAKVSIILDKRRTNEQGKSPIRLRITHNNTNTTISTDVYVSDSSFTGNSDAPISRSVANAKQLNSSIRELYYTYFNAISELDKSGKLRSMSAVDIRTFVENQKEYHAEYTFSFVMQEYMQNSRTDKTKSTFDYTIKKLTQFRNKDKIFFEEINYKFLSDFERWMEEKGIGMSSRGIVFRNIRTIYNYAINNDWVNASQYPFRKFKIKQTRKEKVYLDENKMQQLINLDLSNMQGSAGLSMARDFFLLSFYFCGINPIDLFYLPKQNGHITFVRTKVRFHEPEPVHIKIQQEAQKIIDNYPSETYLIGYADKYSSFESCYHFLKHRLKKLGELIGCPAITFYWARYSWATYASKIDIPDFTISKALGHSDSTMAQQRYISFDWSKVDVANRKVIDYVLRI